MKNLETVQVRSVTLEDAECIYRLSWQLGYSPDLETVRTNITQMLSHPDYELVAAVDETNNLIGWMSLAIRLRIEDVSFLQVAALVTDEKVRGKGIGRLLMQYADRVASERDLPFIGLYSSKPRTDAHRFYENVGYQKAKQSYFFRKDMK